MSESPAEGNPPLYASFEKAYRDASFTPLPVGPDKKPLVKGWTAICPTAAEFEQRLRFHPDANIGLMAGTILSNGNTIAFVDVDEERIVPFICEAVGPVKSAKAAQKGLTVIVQAAPGLKSLKLRAPDKSKPIVEFMISTGMVVLPPSTHPAGMAYRWIGKPLLDIDPTHLPILTAERCAVIKVVLANPVTWAILNGGRDVKAHELMLTLTSSGVALLTSDLEWLSRCLEALFHPDYRGDTKGQILEMLRSAKDKGLGGTGRKPASYDPGSEGPVPLGFTKDGLYALLDRVRQLIILCSSHQLLSPQHLFGMATSDFWREQFPNGKGGMSVGQAGEALIAACRNKGPFLPTRVRGRGVWREGDRIVANFGGPVGSSRFLYLCFEPIELQTGEHSTQPVCSRC